MDANMMLLDQYEKELQQKLEDLPVCEMCGEHIQDEHLYDIDGRIICTACLEDHYRKWTDDYIA